MKFSKWTAIARGSFGITPPQTTTVYSLSSQQIQEAETIAQGLIDVINQIFGTSSLPPVIAFGGGKTTFLATLPGAAANFAEMLSLVRHGRRILLRAQDGQPATFFVGDRVPVSAYDFCSEHHIGGNQQRQRCRSNSGSADQLCGGEFACFRGHSRPARQLASNDLIVANSADNTVSVLAWKWRRDIRRTDDVPDGDDSGLDCDAAI